MRMTPTIILVGILALLAAITLTVVYWPYATADRTPSEIFRPRTAVEAAGRKIYLQNGCVYCHSQSIRAIDWGFGAERIAHVVTGLGDEPILPVRAEPSSIGSSPRPVTTWAMNRYCRFARNRRRSFPGGR